MCRNEYGTKIRGHSCLSSEKENIGICIIAIHSWFIGAG